MKKWNESKKFLFAGISIALIFIVWFVSLIIMCIEIDISASVTQLSSIVIGIFGGIATFYLTGQSIVDMRIDQHNNAVVQNSTERRYEDVNIKRHSIDEIHENVGSRMKDTDYTIL